jgi:hypothetical protein
MTPPVSLGSGACALGGLAVLGKSVQEETVFIAGEQDCIVTCEDLIGLLTKGRNGKIGQPLA